MRATYIERKHPVAATFAGVIIAVPLFLFLNIVMPWQYAAYCAFGLFGTMFFTTYFFAGKKNRVNRIGIMAMAFAFIIIVVAGMHDMPLASFLVF